MDRSLEYKRASCWFLLSCDKINYRKVAGKQQWLAETAGSKLSRHWNTGSQPAAMYNMALYDAWWV